MKDILNNAGIFVFEVLFVVLLFVSVLWGSSRAVLSHEWGCTELSAKGNCVTYHYMNGEQK